MCLHVNAMMSERTKCIHQLHMYLLTTFIEIYSTNILSSLSLLYKNPNPNANPNSICIYCSHI